MRGHTRKNVPRHFKLLLVNFQSRTHHKTLNDNTNDFVELIWQAVEEATLKISPTVE